MGLKKCGAHHYKLTILPQSTRLCQGGRFLPSPSKPKPTPPPPPSPANHHPFSLLLFNPNYWLPITLPFKSPILLIYSNKSNPGILQTGWALLLRPFDTSATAASKSTCIHLFLFLLFRTRGGVFVSLCTYNQANIILGNDTGDILGNSNNLPNLPKLTTPTTINLNNLFKLN